MPTVGSGSNKINEEELTEWFNSSGAQGIPTSKRKELVATQFEYMTLVNFHRRIESWLQLDLRQERNEKNKI